MTPNPTSTAAVMARQPMTAKIDAMRPSRFHRGSPNPTLCGPSPALPVVSDPAQSQPSASARLYLLLSYEEWWFGYILKNDEIALHNHYGFTIDRYPGPGSG